MLSLKRTRVFLGYKDLWGLKWYSPSSWWQNVAWPGGHQESHGGNQWRRWRHSYCSPSVCCVAARCAPGCILLLTLSTQIFRRPDVRDEGPRRCLTERVKVTYFQWLLREGDWQRVAFRTHFVFVYVLACFSHVRLCDRHGSSAHEIPGENSGVSCHLLTPADPGIEPALSHCRQGCSLYHRSNQGRPAL